jgi:prolyl-tRNA synthetase
MLGRVQALVRRHMDSVGGQEMLAPQGFDSLGAELVSYRRIPQIWYQFRGELRMEAWCIDFDPGRLKEAFAAIFAECGVVPAGEIDFMVPSENGEDSLVRCPGCSYAAHLDKAVAGVTAPPVADPDTDAAPEAFHTPGRKTIADVAEFTGLPATSQMKSLVMVADGRIVLALVRGDHRLSRPKLGALIGAIDVRPATPAEIIDAFGAEPGSLGPVGIAGPAIYADKALEGRRNMISGANRTDYHLRNVTPGVDFQPVFADLRQAEAGDPCGVCGAALEVQRAVTIGHVSPGLSHIDIERLFFLAAAQKFDANGMCLPAAVAPFTVVITPVNNADAALREACERIAAECEALGMDVLYDDRDERAGVKFKDADLIGVPFRITVGGKKLALGLVELYERATGRARDVPVEQVAAELRKAL